MSAEPGPLPTFGRYQLVRRLAQGGMAEIYFAKQQGPGGFEKGVVIKRVLPHHASNVDFVSMFLDEARISAILSHPNIVQVFDFGEADGSYYLAMEYLCGEDVRTILREAKKTSVGLPPVVAANIVAGAADGLHHAHVSRDADGRPLNIVHRDISPSNLLVTFQGIVKVLDFGIAKAEGKLQETRTGVVKGKLSYMSPEQIQALPVDARSDVFALGSVLYELLTGHRLFSRDSESATLHALLMEPIPPPSSRVPGLPPDLDAIVVKALQRPLEARYQSAGELKSALDDYLSQFSYVPAQSQLRDYLHSLFGPEYIEGRLAVPTPAVEASPDPISSPSAAKAKSGSLPPPVATQPPVPIEAEAPVSDSRSLPPSPAPGVSRVVVGGLLAALALTATALVAVLRRPPPGPMTPMVVSMAKPTPAPLAPPPAAPMAAAVAAAPTLTPPAAAPPAPAPTPAPPTEMAPAATPEPVAKATSHRPVHSEEHRAHSVPTPGMLTVNCMPWCKVMLDGTDTGKNSPLLNYSVSAGKHELKVINPPTGKSQTLSVQIEPGATTLKTIQL